jgi:hypothetical protein
MVEIILSEPQLPRLKAAVPKGSVEHAALEAGDYFAGDEIAPEPVAVTFSCTPELAQRLLDIARTSCPDVATGIRAANRPTDALGRRNACSALAYIRCGSGVGWQRL